MTRLVLGVLLAGALPLAAQDLSVALGAGRVRYADSLDGTAGAVGARAVFGHDLRVVVLDGAYSQFVEGGWAMQAVGQASLLWAAGRTASLGIAAGASFNQYHEGTPSGTAAAGPMLSWRAGRAHAVVGGSVGAFRTVDSLWAALGSGSLQGSWSLASGVSLSAGVVGSLADTLQFADFTTRFRLAAAGVQAGFHGGVRAGDLADGPWGAIDVTWDVGGRLSLEAAAGRYPQDITGFTDGLYVQAGVRVHARRPSRPPPPPVTVRRLDGQRVRLELQYGSAVGDTLRIAGDWNGWVPVTLTRWRSDRWRVELQLTPGVYAFALLDGDRWVLPRGMAGVDDGFGGVVGTLLVGR